MAKKIIILGAGMMGSALAFPAAENGNDVHIVGTCLDDAIIDGYICRHRTVPEGFRAGLSPDYTLLLDGEVLLDRCHHH